ncbi:MAG: nucleotidyltransferase domain-containing protein [Candidatus Poribacteria bacterium]
MRCELEEIKEPYKSAAKEATEALLNAFDVYSVILYGSVAREEQTEKSDLDLFVIAQDLPDSPLERRKTLFEAAKDVSSKYRIDIFPDGKTVDEVYSYFDPFYFDLYADGIIVYDRKSYGQKLLEQIGKKVKEQKWVRYRTKDGYYGWTIENLKFGQVIEVNFDELES